MFYLKKILLDNNISIACIGQVINVDHSLVSARFNKKRDFSLDELVLIKNYLVSLSIIPLDFDIGTFLDEV